MKIPGYFVFFTMLLILAAIAAGCTASVRKPPATTVVTTTPAAAQQMYQAPSATRLSTAGIDTTIRVRFNDFACIGAQDLLGITYLFPDEKFKLEAASPGANTINVNVLFVDDRDYRAIGAVTPAWDSVKKVWVYEGIVPIVQFNDITTPVEKIITIERQGKYYICADDRKESGTNDVIYQVPVRLTRL